MKENDDRIWGEWWMEGRGGGSGEVGMNETETDEKLNLMTIGGQREKVIERCKRIKEEKGRGMSGQAM